MKRLLSILTALMILMTGIAAGEAAVGNENSDFEIEGTTLVKYRGKGGEVTVPDGVTELGENAFEESTVTKVNLPETLKEIRSYCFSGCYSLEEITLPASLENLEYYYEGNNEITQAQVFAYNPKLKAINVAEGNTHYQSVDGVLFSADGKKLLYYPDGKAMNTYAIPEGTAEIGNSAFCEPAGLQRIEIPSTLRPLSGDFYGIKGLKEIHVSQDNKNYYSVDGVIYGKDKSLECYPIAKEGENLEKGDFPEGISSIGDAAFRHNQSLKTIELPEGITELGWRCFGNMKSLNSIVVPATVKEISGYAFADCGNLEKVTILNPNVRINGRENILDDSGRAVLYGYEGSTTQAYAKKNNLKFESLGTAPGKERMSAGNNAGTETNINSDFEIKGTTLVKYHGFDDEVTIPDGITTLGAYAFDSEEIKKVNLPESLKKIDDHCFYNCCFLTDITIPANVSQINEFQVFGYSQNFQAIHVAEGNKRYTSVDGILFTSDKRTLVYYPDAKEGDTYSIPEKTTKLGQTAFEANKNLKAIIIPSTLNRLPDSALFCGLSSLENILVSPANNNYSSFDGALYDRSNKLIAYPNAKNAESLEANDFAQGVKSIGSWAFLGNRNLKNIEMPESVTSIGWMCFTNMKSLESITIPASVKKIPRGAFEGCPKLERVTILNPKAVFEEFVSDAISGSEDAVLYGYEGSTTQAYAEKCGLKFESLGAVPGKEAKAAANTKEDKAPAAEQAAEKAATPEKDFEIDGTTLVKYKGRGGEVTVPEGVTKLGEWAFEDSNVTKVNLPESLKEIESYCFFSSKNLQEVTIPAGTNKISEAQVFAFCTGIEEFRVAEGNKRYTTVDGVLFTADKRTQICYPDGKKDETYIIPEKTTKLGYTAFESNAQMTTLVIPSTLARFLEGPLFSNLSVLQNIFVSPANNNYRSFDGVLYDRTNTLIYYPGGRAAEHLGENDFAEGIKALSPWAFQHARNLKSVELPDGLMTVGWMCFSFSDKLESVTIPASVKSIDGYAFCDCENLQKVTILNPDMTFKRDDKDILNGSPKAILCGYDNSTTQAYAEKHGLKFESLGAAPGKTK